MPRMKKICFFCAVSLLVYVAGVRLFGVFNIGSVVFLGLALTFFLLPFVWEKIRNIRFLRRALTACIVLAAGIVALISSLMLYQGYGNPPPSEGNYTLIVLGAKLIGTQPSLMLKHRLATALDYLNNNPQAVCIVSGGQGADEIMPEAEGMAAWLIERGIEKERILIEPNSVNTEENIRFSMELIPSDSEGVAIVTDGFHQMRASLHAQAQGLEPYAIPSVTPWGLFPVYWMREVGGVPLTWLIYQFS